MTDAIILAQVVADKNALQYEMPKSEKGDNSVKYLLNFARS